MELMTPCSHEAVKYCAVNGRCGVGSHTIFERTWGDTAGDSDVQITDTLLVFPDRYDIGTIEPR